METSGDMYQNKSLRDQFELSCFCFFGEHDSEDFLHSHCMTAGIPGREEVAGAVPGAIVI